VGECVAIDGSTCNAVNANGRNVTPDKLRPITSANQELGLFRKDDSRDDGATDAYQCPAGAQLTCRVASVEPGRHIRSDATSSCKACPLKLQCTRNKGGQRLTRRVLNLVEMPRLLAALS
jgi:hypothetical protein